MADEEDNERERTDRAKSDWAGVSLYIIKGVIGKGNSSEINLGRKSGINTGGKNKSNNPSEDLGRVPTIHVLRRPSHDVDALTVLAQCFAWLIDVRTEL